MSSVGDGDVRSNLSQPLELWFGKRRENHSLKTRLSRDLLREEIDEETTVTRIRILLEWFVENDESRV